MGSTLIAFVFGSIPLKDSSLGIMHTSFGLHINNSQE
jgi:hypothetical protein